MVGGGGIGLLGEGLGRGEDGHKESEPQIQGGGLSLSLPCDRGDETGVPGHACGLDMPVISMVLRKFAAFLDDVEAVGGECGEFVDGAGGPADFDVGGGGLVEAEVDAEVVLGEVAAAGADFVDLYEGLGGWVAWLLGWGRVVTRRRAPMPERFDLVPTRRSLIQLRWGAPGARSQRRSWGEGR